MPYVLQFHTCWQARKSCRMRTRAWYCQTRDFQQAQIAPFTARASWHEKIANYAAGHLFCLTSEVEGGISFCVEKEATELERLSKDHVQLRPGRAKAVTLHCISLYTKRLILLVSIPFGTFRMVCQSFHQEKYQCAEVYLRAQIS